MGSLIERVQGDVAESEERPLVLDVVGDESDVVLDALAADTRRRVFRALFEQPATASALADRLDESVQTVHYHLSTLQDAGLVEHVDARYSEKGNEMAVYGPASDPIVLVGNEEFAPAVERSMTRIVGGVGLLAAAGLLVQYGVERLARGARLSDDAAQPASAVDGVAPDGTLANLVLDVLEPGLVFFLGTLALVAALAVVRR
ncbi:helix-turn-helix transcriptional regulator [Halorubellus sp. JP-L1]|uniref:ArsR/SmtB family transcription factor n=1 Tax=Halorubellus sp. JP-L1 TaxID=2715753 RepID=UPI001409DBE3|nr:helix-turn-helix domain-containing protein [Halorubellus sp. JP-L1]NHN43225.1 helix-turn-helix transcriptional regulator [Halorubellus sp. JP-L1]